MVIFLAMKSAVVASILLVLGGGAQALELSRDQLHRHCGVNTIGELTRSGWAPYLEGYISKIGDSIIVLEDNSSFSADMTVGIFSGDHAIVLSKYVRGEKNSGYIYNLCAGGFDAWVVPLN